MNPAPINALRTRGINYLFPENDTLPKGKLSDLPLDAGKTLEPVKKLETEVVNNSPSPGVDKEFFSFFTLSSYPIPVGAQKPAIDLDSESEK